MTLRLPALLLLCSLGVSAALADPTPAPNATPAALATPAVSATPLAAPAPEATPAVTPSQTQLPAASSTTASATPTGTATSGPIFGAGTSATPHQWPASTPPAMPSVDGLGRAATGFIVLLIIAGVGLYLLKNGFAIRPQKGADRKLNVLETRMLGNRQFLVVVQYDHQKVLLGVTPGKIDYLCALADQAAPAGADFEALVAKETKKTES